MNPLMLGSVVNIGANLGGSLLGEALSAEDEAEYRRQLEMQARALEGLKAPNLQWGDVGSTLNGMPQDMGNRGARNAAIQALMKEGLSGGNSLESQLAQANAQRAAGQATRAASQGALQSAAARGMGGASSTLQAQLLGASTGADRAAQVGLQGAADARRSALAALQQGGAMAGNAEEGDASREMARRQSLDRMAQFNAAQKMAAQQQNFQNQQAVAGNRADAAGLRGRGAREKADRTRRTWGGVGQAVGEAGAGYAMYGKR